MLGIDIIIENVISIEKKDLFIVKTETSEYLSASVIFTTGSPPSKPNISGIEKFEGKGIHYCVSCDGYFYRDSKIGILGNNDLAIHEANSLLDYTKDITIFTNNKPFNFKNENSKFRIVNNAISDFCGDEFLNSVQFSDGSLESIDGMFIANGTTSISDLALKLGVLVNNNSIKVDANHKTNIDGVFAAGDCTGGFKQISVAVGQGAIAGQNIIEYIKNKKKEELQ